MHFLPEVGGSKVQGLDPGIALLTATAGDESSCFCTAASCWPGLLWHLWPWLFGLSCTDSAMAVRH
jgi:hypothetical protein